MENNDCTGFPLRVIRSCKYGEMENADDYQLLNNDVLAFMDADSKAAVSVTIVAADEEKQYTICRKTIYSRNYPQMTCREFQKKYP